MLHAELSVVWSITGKDFPYLSVNFRSLRWFLKHWLASKIRFAEKSLAVLQSCNKCNSAMVAGNCNTIIGESLRMNT